MAKDVTSSVWIFDTANDAEGIANVGAAGVVFDNVPIYIQYINLDTGDGGNILVNESSGGKRILKADGTSSNDAIQFPINRYVRGVFLETITANGSIEIAHGVPTDD